jgi:transaldolase
LLGKTWVENNQIRRKAEEGATKQKKQELRDFMARRIARLIEEQENDLKQQKARELAVKIPRTREGLKTISMQEKRTPTLDVIREEILHLKPLREH